MALGRDKNAQLSMMIGMTIQGFTKTTPMSVLEIIDVLFFTAGHAAAQKAAIESLPHKLRDPRKLREHLIESYERGHREGSVDHRKPQVFLPGGQDGSRNN